MKHPAELFTTFQGKICAGFVSSSPARLTIQENEVTLRFFFMNQYRFEPQQLVSIEASDSETLIFKHALVKYPSEISFSPVTSTAEIMEEMKRVGFTPSASADNISVREDRPILQPVSILTLFFLFFLFIVDARSGVVELYSISLGQYSPFLLFLISFLIRYIPILQNFILRPGRYIGEIIPYLDTIMLISGILSLANILVRIGVPGLVVIALCYGVLLLMARIDRRFNVDVRQQQNPPR